MGETCGIQWEACTWGERGPGKADNITKASRTVPISSLTLLRPSTSYNLSGLLCTDVLADGKALLSVLM